MAPFYSLFSLDNLKVVGCDIPADGVIPLPADVLARAISGSVTPQDVGMWQETIAISCARTDRPREKLISIVNKKVICAFAQKVNPLVTTSTVEGVDVVTLDLSVIGIMWEFGDQLITNAKEAWLKQRRNEGYAPPINNATAFTTAVKEGDFTHAFNPNGEFRFSKTIPASNILEKADSRKLDKAGLTPVVIDMRSQYARRLKDKVETTSSVAQCEELIGRNVVPDPMTLFPNLPLDMAKMARDARGKVIKALAQFRKVHLFGMIVPSEMISTFTDYYEAEVRPYRDDPQTAQPMNALAMMIRRAATAQQDVKDMDADRRIETPTEKLVHTHEMIYHLNSNATSDPSFPTPDVYHFLLEKAEVASYNVSVAIFEWRRKVFQAVQLAWDPLKFIDGHDYIRHPFLDTEIKAVNEALKSKSTLSLLARAVSRNNRGNGGGNGGRGGGRGGSDRGADAGGRRNNNDSAQSRDDTARDTKHGKRGKGNDGRNNNNNNNDKEKRNNKLYNDKNKQNSNKPNPAQDHHVTSPRDNDNSS